MVQECAIIGRMKIGHTRRELIKSRIARVIDSGDKLTNGQLAERFGIHRNTVRRYLGEINQKEDQEWQIKRGMTLMELEEQAEAINMELMGLWTDAYSALCTEKPSQLVQVSMARWQLQKDIARLKLLLECNFEI